MSTFYFYLDLHSVMAILIRFSSVGQAMRLCLTNPDGRTEEVYHSVGHLLEHY